MTASANKFKPRKPEDFRAAHDKSLIVPAKITEGLKRLGANGWVYESEFIVMIGVSHTDFSRHRAGFDDFVVTPRGKNPRRAWCGSKALAAKLRGYAE